MPHKTSVTPISRFIPSPARMSRAIFACFLLAFALTLTTLITPYRPEQAVTPFTENTTPADQYYRAKIETIKDGHITVTILDGELFGATKTFPGITSSQMNTLKEGQTIVVAKNSSVHAFSVIDSYRIPGLLAAIILFFILVVFVGRRRGAASLVGLLVSILVVGWFIIPLILSGHSALWVSIAGAYIIALFSIVIAHGRKPRTYISLLCVALILAFVACLSYVAVNVLTLRGLADEAATLLTISRPNIDMAGVLIGGIIIASLGVLDDIVTAQVATVDELQKANSSLSRRELYTRALSVGREHIASLVNTLVLVYVGAALPVIISIATYSNNMILFLNGEYLATEIIRTIIASSGLVIAVPVSTIVAATILHKMHQYSATAAVTAAKGQKS